MRFKEKGADYKEKRLRINLDRDDAEYLARVMKQNCPRAAVYAVLNDFIARRKKVQIWSDEILDD